MFGVNLRAIIPKLSSAVLFAVVLVAAHSTQAQTFTVLHNFTGGADGAYPGAALTIDRVGNLYGTSEHGGESGHFYSYGTVFKLVHQGSAWVLNPLYNFTGCADGWSPSRTVIGPDGSLYGATFYGGVSGCDGSGCGVVFNLKPPAQACRTASCEWTETVLHRFTGGSDGANPDGALIFDYAGNIYGATSCGFGGCYGTVYELMPASGGWSEKTLYEFTGGADGWQDHGGVIFDQVGNLYGTTINGGAYTSGTVFQLTPSGSGWTKTILHSFSGSDGFFPVGGLIFDNSGSLYGTTSWRGSGGGGTVFELSPSGAKWTLTVLYSFICPGCINLPGPQDSLVRDGAGSLYGTTYKDGTYSQGSVFRLTPHANRSWTYTDLHDFSGGTDGGLPVGTVTLDADGNLFGTASSGGQYGYGVVFEITP